MSRKNIFYICLISLFICTALIVLSVKTPIFYDLFGLSFFSKTKFIHKAVVNLSTSPTKQRDLSQKINSLNNSNQLKALQTENSALRDQFQTTDISPQILLPAEIVNAPSFIPGITQPQSLILNQGSSSNVKTGQAVIYKNIAVGKISKVTAYFSEVTLISDSSVVLPAKTHNTNALGIIKGQLGNNLLLDNVILSDHLEIGDVVISKGDQTLSGLGYPPDIIIGKITQIDKNPSALFQKANVQNPLDFAHLTTVFIITTRK